MELTELKGIGEKTAEALGRLGILTVEDLAAYYPRDYEEFGEPQPLYTLTPGGMAVVEGVLPADAVLNRFKGMTIVNARLADMSGRLQLSWFNLPYIKNILKSGAHFIFRGRIYEKNGRLIMNQPSVFKPEDYREKYCGRLMPLYPLTRGISGKKLMNAAAEALKQTGGLKEYLSEQESEALGLFPEEQLQIRLHFPKNREELYRVRKRAAFDEFLLFFLAAARLKRSDLIAESGYKCRPDFRVIQMISSLPYALTEAQNAAYKDIMKDMTSGRVMNRLIEGDVGSGKTIVAVLAMLLAACNGYQSAFMAPTEVLAVQHYEKLKELLEISGLPFHAVLLTGSAGREERRKSCSMIENHEADLIIGTHALFQEEVRYHSLGLIIADEQHRFGVAQREALREKGGMPHTLIMSATPIPRTLAKILYQDLDVSVIDQIPSGRKKIKNCVVGPSYKETALKFISDEISKGHQAYIICPSIEKGDEEETGPSELQNVTDLTEELKGRGFRCEALHGRMKPAEKERVMTRFKQGELDLLISTTVVEVGVDVPNATVMLIENAERYGLAQLHQLRGRVGRGDAQSYCIMMNRGSSKEAEKRLEVLNTMTDGFQIAEEDLKLRGPGELNGLRQSGDLNFRLADIYQDADMLAKARAFAGKLEEEDPQLGNGAHAELGCRLEVYMQNSYTG